MTPPSCPPHGGQKRVRATSASWGVGVPSVRRLKTAGDIRVELGRLYRLIERDEIDVGKGRAMVYLLATLSSHLKTTDLEARIEALEAGLEGNREP